MNNVIRPSRWRIVWLILMVLVVMSVVTGIVIVIANFPLGPKLMVTAALFVVVVVLAYSVYTDLCKLLTWLLVLDDEMAIYWPNQTQTHVPWKRVSRIYLCHNENGQISLLRVVWSLEFPEDDQKPDLNIKLYNLGRKTETRLLVLLDRAVDRYQFGLEELPESRL